LKSVWPSNCEAIRRHCRSFSAPLQSANNRGGKETATTTLMKPGPIGTKPKIAGAPCCVVAIQLSASDCRTIAIYEYTALEKLGAAVDDECSHDNEKDNCADEWPPVIFGAPWVGPPTVVARATPAFNVWVYHIHSRVLGTHNAKRVEPVPSSYEEVVRPLAGLAQNEGAKKTATT
jgi:hypothetical protein